MNCDNKSINQFLIVKNSLKYFLVSNELLAYTRRERVLEVCLEHGVYLGFQLGFLLHLVVLI